MTAKTSRRLMEEAISQRSRCFLSLPQTVTGIKELDCSIRESSSRGLLLESTAKAAAGPHWVGLPVTGFFRLVLRDHGLEETFYTFDSSIRGAATGPAGQARLRLREPEALVFGQRRKSLRVEPDLDRLQKAFLWRYDKGATFALDAPALRGSDFQAGLARLADISAGGMRLVLRAALVRDRDLLLARGQRLVIHLQFDEPRVAATNEFWMVARVSHVARDRISQDETVGMEFLAGGSLDPKAGKIRWETVTDHVIPGLADIFYHWHLDRHREKLA
ncbi:hypothetical protein DFW101_3048 [Solidesulfovibrio carbinoliphilus subsp. oakridgensis]|uniref:PilZ domain-containing protein n=1 Tax=Solidesulfovibrio carbinoliphilus subsp. oakridgensis TaxID=694327 RepID=G7Q791_9BACT|nr:PilZ domain-containing protein [Solidesulfovibrio carbinoliphilus]EHJ49048.1 hypothetical protein DFW101_3048 [Solidesulfovibrio carbinoliphilus subsp. oakridgensis]